ATDILSRELEQIVPTYSPMVTTVGWTNFNFYTYGWNEFYQSLPASGSVRTNILDHLFFVTHQNRTWTGVGYFVVPDSGGVAGNPVPAGSLYRFESSMSSAEFQGNPHGLFYNFAQ